MLPSALTDDKVLISAVVALRIRWLTVNTAVSNETAVCTDGGGVGSAVGITTTRQRLKTGGEREVGALAIDTTGDNVGPVEGVDDGKAVGG